MTAITAQPRSLRLSGWSLRARIVATLVALLAVACLALGATSILALQSFLVGRLDAQLQSASGRSAGAGRATDPRGDGASSPLDAPAAAGGGARFLLAPGQPAGTVGARLRDGVITDAGVLSESGRLQQVDAAAVQELAAVTPGSAPRTITIDGLGDFRVLATTTGGDDDVIVTGLPLAGLHATVYRLIAVEGGVLVVVLALAGLAGGVIVRRTLEPLHRVAALATRVTSLPLERGDVDLAERVPAADTDPRTEVGQVGGALNRMLDHVGAALSARQASEVRVRQFVADASHELRTPLASIRGYAELTRRSREPVPADVSYALARVESEAQRMTMLVDDLLLLARLDSGRPIEHQQVDLSALLIDAVSDAAAAGPDHVWRLGLPEAPVHVPGDDARLRQVLANLLANARTHTRPGTTVTAGLSAGTDQVVLTICDDGAGMPADLVPHVFERFARGDGSRTRGPGSASTPTSTGLGLAIVAAIVQAHGGAVSVTSAPGQTAFVVSLAAGRQGEHDESYAAHSSTTRIGQTPARSSLS